MRGRVTAVGVVLAIALLSAPAIATCPGCCAPARGAASFACAVATDCRDCDPLVRTVLPYERAPRLHLSVQAPAAAPSRAPELAPALRASIDPPGLAFVRGRTLLCAGVPLRL